MVKIDLITGFLGSGKTTFIKKYAEYLLSRGFNIGILENDYGAVNIDMMLLQDLAGENCELEMISGGADKETHIRRFRTKLISMGMCGYDRVIVEPSGIYDVDEFFDVLCEEPLDKWYEIGNVITIVDAGLEDNLSEEAEYFLASQAANSGKIILSHTDEVTKEKVKNTILHLNMALEKIMCKRRVDNEIIEKGIHEFSDGDWENLYSCGYVSENYQKADIEKIRVFETLYIMNVKMSIEALKNAAVNMMKDLKCGKIFRIKGFLKDEDGRWIKINAARGKVSIMPVTCGQEIMIIIGENLDKDEVDNYIIYS